MPQQNSGWAATPNIADITIKDAFQRNLLMKYGGRKDDVWNFHDFPGYKREMDAWGRPAPNNSVVGEGNYSHTFSGGNTSSNPGAYNWNTFTNNLNRASGVGWGMVDWRMKDKRMAADRAKDSNYVTNYQQQANKALGHTAPNYSSWYQQQASTQASGTPQSTNPTSRRRPGRRSPYSGPQPPAPPVP